MVGIQFKYNSGRETAEVTINSTEATVTELCISFRNFLVAAGFDYIDYKYLAEVFAELSGPETTEEASNNPWLEDAFNELKNTEQED